MRRTLKLYIEGLEVDQFQDTQITMTSSIQNVSDISKVFTDLTQSFTVPASPRNNQIFQHYYESDVSSRQQKVLDHNLRRKAVIEIDTITYRTGKVSIEKANIKDGMPYSYQITFYGDLVTMKDIFGEDKLADLDWSMWDSPYSFNDVVDRVELDDTINNYQVRYPLISSKRSWQYANPTTPADNINTIGGAINWSELFPALQLENVLKTIEINFNVSFVGTFRQDARWINAWMWFKNKFEQAFITPPVDMQIDSATDGVTTIGINDVLTVNQGSGAPRFQVDTFSGAGHNYIQYYYTTYPILSGVSDAGTHKVYLNVNVSNPAVNYYVDVYVDGFLFTTIQQIGNQYFEVYSENNTNNPSLVTTLSFKFRSESPISITASWDYALYVVLVPATPAIPINPLSGTFLPIVTQQTLSLQTCAPDIKVIDWIQGIVKMFNLTIVPNSPTEYVLETLETWYGQGSIFNITEFTDVTNIDVSRIKLYKTIAYSYQKSESLINRNFQGNFIREYGDLSAVFPYDGQEFKIDIPFEDILTSNIDGASTCVGYALNNSLQPYQPKPIILYKQTGIPTNIWFTDGVTNRQINTYEAFTADAYIGNDYWSLNWGAEISPLYNAINLNGLYATYYQAYIQNLFNRKNRMTSVVVKLPLWILTQLSLNDRMVIRDKRYIINDFSVNLSTGETKMTLINDFRRIAAMEVQDIHITLPYIGNTTQALILLQNNVEALVAWATAPPPTWRISGLPPADMPLTLRSSTYIDIEVPENNPHADFLTTEVDDLIFITERNDNIISEQGEFVSATLEVTRTNTITGEITTQFIYITQEYV